MTKLINVNVLIKDLKYDAELDARALDDTDLSLSVNRELVQFDKDCKQAAVDMLKEVPTVDAIPIEWIGEWLSDRSILWDTPSEVTIKQMVADWRAENRRKQNEARENK